MVALIKWIVNPLDKMSLIRGATNLKLGIGEKLITEVYGNVSGNIDHNQLYLALSGLYAGKSFPKRANAFKEILTISIGETKNSKTYDVYMKLLTKFNIIATIKKQDQMEHLSGIHKDRYREESLNALITSVEDSEYNLEEFLDRCKLENKDDKEEEKDEVTLSTFHKFKGLEKSVVIMVNCADGNLPHAMSKKDICELTQERNLYYVAQTRAQNMLFMLYTKNMKVFGQSKVMPRSEFILNNLPLLLKKKKNGALVHLIDPVKI